MSNLKIHEPQHVLTCTVYLLIIKQKFWQHWVSIHVPFGYEAGLLTTRPPRLLEIEGSFDHYKHNVGENCTVHYI